MCCSATKGRTSSLCKGTQRPLWWHRWRLSTIVPRWRTWKRDCGHSINTRLSRKKSIALLRHRSPTSTLPPRSERRKNLLQEGVQPEKIFVTGNTDCRRFAGHYRPPGFRAATAIIGWTFPETACKVRPGDSASKRESRPGATRHFLSHPRSHRHGARLSISSSPCI